MPPSRTIDQDRAEALVGWLVRPVASLGKNVRRVLEAPDLAVDRLHRTMRAAWEAQFSRGPDAFSAWLADLAREVETSRMTERETEERAAAFVSLDPMAKKFWPVVLRAHAAFPNSPLAIIPNPVGWGRAVLNASSALYEAEQSSGSSEAQGKACLRAFAAVSDGVYVTYLTKLTLLHQLSIGATPKHPARKLGLLCPQVAALVNDAALVDPHAGHIRNAIAHRHTRHLGRGRFKLWEKPRANGERWELEVDADELFARADHMQQAACGLPTALNAFSSVAMWKIFSPIFPQLRALLLQELTTEEAARLSAEHEARFACAFERIPRAVWELHGAGEDPKLAELASTGCRD